MLLKSLTQDEAKQWYERLTEEKRIEILIEHYYLKQALCSQTLGVPTGCPDWPTRAIKRAEELRNCQVQIRKLILKTTEAVEEAAVSTRTFTRECQNCQGTGRTSGIEDNRCPICQGTGLRGY